MKPVFLNLALLFFWTFLSAQMCTMVLAHGKDYATDPYHASFKGNQEQVFSAVKQTLENQGYDFVEVNTTKAKMVTSWKPVGAGSHYANLFERKDYGVSDGAYYQLVANFLQQPSNVKVSLSCIVKSIAGPLQSSGKIEKKVFKQVEDYLRTPLIEMTNVGVSNR